MAKKPSVFIPPEQYFTHHGFRWVHSDLFENSWVVEVELLPFMKTLPSPARYLKKVAPDFGWARLLLEHGKRMRVSPYQPPRKQKIGHCYENSFAVRRHAINEMDGVIWHYAEGIAITPNGPELHAWNNVANHVFDTTWSSPHGAKYFGITFTDEFLQWVWFATGQPFGLFCRLGETATYIDNYCRSLGKGGLRT